MFTFTEEELMLAPQMRSSLIPPHMRTEDSEPANPSERSASHQDESVSGSQTSGNNPELGHPASALDSTTEDGA